MICLVIPSFIFHLNNSTSFLSPSLPFSSVLPPLLSHAARSSLITFPNWVPLLCFQASIIYSAFLLGLLELPSMSSNSLPLSFSHFLWQRC
ncbi:hypothetical protein BJX65DRAFT_275107 [Aspergillus insuetus]